MKIVLKYGSVVQFFMAQIFTLKWSAVAGKFSGVVLLMQWRANFSGNNAAVVAQRFMKWHELKKWRTPSTAQKQFIIVTLSVQLLKEMDQQLIY